VKGLDWNKTKTIFIVVFSILNIFLYSLYVNRHTEAENVQLRWETTIEESLQLDNIQYEQLPADNQESSYLYAEVAKFKEAELNKLENQVFNVLDETFLLSRFQTPVEIKKGKEKGDYDFRSFLTKYVLHGNEYMLWKIDEEKRFALFFQKVKDNPIYFNKNAMLYVYWNEEGFVTNYEQRMFGEFVSYNKKKDLLAPIQALDTLYSRHYLKPDSIIKSISLGYSALIQPTKTQVFAPTWRVHVELKDGRIEDYFINAIDGKITEFQKDTPEEENN